MSVLLAELRRDLGNFEIIDWQDRERLEVVRASRSIDCVSAGRWAWEYASESKELRSLYEKGKTGQWNARDEIDWSTSVSENAWVVDPEQSLTAIICRFMGKSEAVQRAAAFDELAYTASQLLHGEQAALQMAGQLMCSCERTDEKLCAAGQAVDEARHVEVFSRFLLEKMGGIYPVDGTVKVLLEAIFRADGVRKKILGMQLLFEGLALGVMANMRAISRNALFADIISRIEGDEARHAAFGVLCMRRVVGKLEPEERDELEDWSLMVVGAMNASHGISTLRAIGAKYDIDPVQTMKVFTALPEFPKVNSASFMHTVIPNLRRLGLLTQRTEATWRKQGMLFE
jgi:hypothetical protein